MKKLFFLSVFVVTFSYAQVTDENGLSATSLKIPLSGNIGIGVTPSPNSPNKFEVNGRSLFNNTITLGSPNGARTLFQTNSNHKIYAPTNMKTIDLDGNWKGGGFIGVYRDDVHNSEGVVNMHAHLDSRSYKLNIDELEDQAVKSISKIKSLTKGNTVKSIVIEDKTGGSEKNVDDNIKKIKINLTNSIYKNLDEKKINDNLSKDSTTLSKIFDDLNEL